MSRAKAGKRQWRTWLTQTRTAQTANGMNARAAGRAPFSLLLPVPGGERNLAVQYLSLMHARCCPLSQRGHCVAGESSK